MNEVHGRISVLMVLGGLLGFLSGLPALVQLSLILKSPTW